tara:strand:+ start:7148 stop:7648 length:501 start_codon:yes stop_codon:yes gene_type:complete
MICASRPSYRAWFLFVLIWSVSFLLHFFWEMAQVPFFTGMMDAPHGAVVWLCTRAAIGDANIALFAYGVAAVVTRDGFWIQGWWRRHTLGAYFASGLFITIVFEAWATGVGQRWSYNDAMPLLPFLGTGIAPLVQWVIVPIISLYSLRWLYRGWLDLRRQDHDHTR